MNGAETRESWPIVVENRPPEVWSSAGTLSVPHAYDPGAAEYRATTALSTWVDPEGDPLVQAGATGDSQCADSTWWGASRSCAAGWRSPRARRRWASSRGRTS